MNIPVWSVRLTRAMAAGYDPLVLQQSVHKLTRKTVYIATGIGAAGMVGGILLRDGVVLEAFLSLAVLYPFLVLRRWEGASKQRARMIAIELPGYVNTIMLLVNAGESIPRAFVKAGEQKLKHQPEFQDHPLYRELQKAAFELANRTPFAEALQAFSRRCAVKEISMLVGSLLLQYTRGGEDFLYAMRDLSRTLWDQRRVSARTSGEEAAAKLVFPMIIIFAVVMAVVAAPAVFLLHA